jgi:hypothetical protein
VMEMSDCDSLMRAYRFSKDTSERGVAANPYEALQQTLQREKTKEFKEEYGNGMACSPQIYG